MPGSRSCVKIETLRDRLAHYLDSRLAHFLARRDDPAFAFLPCLFHRLIILPATGNLLCQLRHVLADRFPVENHSHPAPILAFQAGGAFSPRPCPDFTYGHRFSGISNVPIFSIHPRQSCRCATVRAAPDIGAWHKSCEPVVETCSMARGIRPLTYRLRSSKAIRAMPWTSKFAHAVVARRAYSLLRSAGMCQV